MNDYGLQFDLDTDWRCYKLKKFKLIKAILFSKSFYYFFEGAIKYALTHYKFNTAYSSSVSNLVEEDRFQKIWESQE